MSRTCYDGQAEWFEVSSGHNEVSIQAFLQRQAVYEWMAQAVDAEQ